MMAANKLPGMAVAVTVDGKPYFFNYGLAALEDKVPVTEVAAWEKGFLEFIQNQKSEVRDQLAAKKDLTDDLVKKIEASIAEFKAQYAAGETATKKKEREAVIV